MRNLIFVLILFYSAITNAQDTFNGKPVCEYKSFIDSVPREVVEYPMSMPIEILDIYHPSIVGSGTYDHIVLGKIDIVSGDPTVDIMYNDPENTITISTLEYGRGYIELYNIEDAKSEILELRHRIMELEEVVSILYKTLFNTKDE